jgi:Domain of unknown function (DUF4386)
VHLLEKVTCFLVGRLQGPSFYFILEQPAKDAVSPSASTVSRLHEDEVNNSAGLAVKGLTMSLDGRSGVPVIPQFLRILIDRVRRETVSRGAWLEGSGGMNERNLGYDVTRIAGYSAILFGALLIFQMVCQRLVGADVYAETGWPTTFSQITEHKALYSIGAASGALAQGCTIPLVAGFWFSSQKKDAPLAFIASGFLLLSCVILIVSTAQYGNLVGTSFDYANNVVPHYVTIETGDSIGDQFQILQYAGFVSFGVGLIFFSRLMNHSEVAPKPVVWLSAIVGFAAFLSSMLPSVFIAGRLAWAFSLGFTWLRGPVTEPGDEPESAVAF